MLYCCDASVVSLVWGLDILSVPLSVLGCDWCALIMIDNSISLTSITRPYLRINKGGAITIQSYFKIT